MTLPRRSGIDVAVRAQGSALLALRIAVVVLTVLGITAAVIRLVNVHGALAIPAASRPPFQPSDQRALELTIAATKFEPGSAEYVRTRIDFAKSAARFVDHPVYTVMHMLPGILILLLAPLQFSSAIRDRHRTYHRWAGRFLLVMYLSIVISGFYFGVVNAPVSPWERPTIAIFSAIVAFAATRAYLAIRRRDVARHREWMVRTLAMALGISTVRIASVVMLLTLRDVPVTTIFLLSMWVGWPLTIAVAELWIRRTRASTADVSLAVPLHPRGAMART